MSHADHFQSYAALTAHNECQVLWTALDDSDPVLGLEAALPYLLDHAPVTFAEPAPAVVSNTRHAA